MHRGRWGPTRLQWPEPQPNRRARMAGPPKEQAQDQMPRGTPQQPWDPASNAPELEEDPLPPKSFLAPPVLTEAMRCAAAIGVSYGVHARYQPKAGEEGDPPPTAGQTGPRQLQLGKTENVSPDEDHRRPPPAPFLLSCSFLCGYISNASSDYIYYTLPQRLRCRCNFHALRFVHKIQETGALLVERLHGHRPHSLPLEDNLLGHFAGKSAPNGNRNDVSKYLAVHLRFEIDMVAYSMCYFGGGKDEEEELETYRQIHFPALTEIRKTTKLPSAAFLRSEGKCPLAPEEAVLMLAAIGFKRSTNIYIAGAEIYGGRHRMAAISRLYPALVTKETLLSPLELEPFRNFSSQLAALDFVACAAADAFAMTDSGSQFSSLVQGYRMYYGGGDLPTIRPNKRRLASILVKNATIEWKEFETRVKKLIQQTKQVHERPIARSIFRHPRCLECMCRTDN